MNKKLTFGKIRKLVVLLLLIQAHSLHAQNIVWQKSFGGSMDDFSSSIKPTSDGGFIHCGYSISNTSGDKSENTIGSWDYWVVKLDSIGNIQWENTIGGIQEDKIWDIIETTNGGFLLGGYSKSNISGDKTDSNCNNYINQGDYWILKINSFGAIEWQKALGSCGNETFSSIEHSSDGGYWASGFTPGNATCDKTSTNTATSDPYSCNPNTNDIWILKLDSTGNLLYQAGLGRGQWADEKSRSITSTIDGGLIAVSSSFISTSPAILSKNEIWITKFNSTCNLQWTKVYGGTGEDIPACVKLLSDGTYICGGSSTSDISGTKTDPSFGSYDFWILKLDSLGNIIWQKSIGGSGSDVLNYISPTFDNGFICGGSSNSPISGLKTSANFGQYDYWIVKLDSIGNIEWQRTIGGSGNDNLSTITQLQNGHYLGGGSSNSNISGNKTIDSKGGYDYWDFELDDASNYNLITGSLYYDFNGNNIKDSSDINLPFGLVKLSNSNRIVFSQADGSYILPVSDTGSYTVSQIQNNYFQSSTPLSHNATFTGMNQIDSLNDFATTILTIEDLQISITPIGAFRSGFGASYNIEYKNKGSIPLQGTITFYPDTNLTYLSSSNPPISVSTDSIIWQTPIINSLSQGNFNVTVHVNTSVPIGYLLSSSVKIEPVTTDQNPINNYASWQHIVTGSSDPNDILVDRDSITTEEILDPPYLDYIIRFQNTGNDTAFTVKILNPIDTFKLDLMSIEIISSSHSFNLNYIPEGNLEFKFENILLPDSNINEPNSHGFVRYRIRPKSTIAVHDSITNYAAIYFDYNLPVITNTAVTKIVYPSNYIEIFPTVCDSLISPSGNYTFSTAGLYFDTIPGNGSGVDSIYVINLKMGASYKTLNVTSCEKYTSPSGNYMWNSSGVYSDTITNHIGCDSVITINLTVKNTTTSSLLISECNSYSSPSGNFVWTTSGIYTDTIPNAAGCDSIITIDLSIHGPSDSTISVSSCNDYISPSGNYIFSSSGTYQDTVTNIYGCDSLITINLTVKQSTNSTLNTTACNSYTSPSNNYIWNTTGIYYDTIPNSIGCDSIIMIDLTVYYHSSATINATECDNYTSPSGHFIWDTSGTYFDTIPNYSGCDSIITINLTINSIDTSIALNPPIFTSNAIASNYQWMYCDSVIIPGEVTQIFLATINGSYAVILMQNGCIDTSSCYSIYNVGTIENKNLANFTISPNPTLNNFSIFFEKIITKGKIEISNTIGETLYEQNIFNESKKEITIENISPGIYFVMVYDNNIRNCKKLIIAKD
jgi:hypothetical protein